MLVAVVLLPGCVVGSTDETSDTPRRDLAAVPQSLPPASAPPMTATASASAGTSLPPGASGSAAASAPASRGPSASAPAPGPGGSSAPAAPFRLIATIDDRSGDAGATTAKYADITSVTIEDNGTDARVTLWFAAAVPPRMPANEVLGVGVDLYRSRLDLEGDYQLYADGQPEGWYAYLHTPKGFVKYRGMFGIGGNRVVFTVPWTALGSRSSGAFSGFTDWTRTTAAGNLAGEDLAPDIGSEPYSR